MKKSTVKRRVGGDVALTQRRRLTLGKRHSGGDLGSARSRSSRDLHDEVDETSLARRSMQLLATRVMQAGGVD